jgi:hypothetical protein
MSNAREDRKRLTIDQGAVNLCAFAPLRLPSAIWMIKAEGIICWD